MCLPKYWRGSFPRECGWLGEKGREGEGRWGKRNVAKRGLDVL